MSVLLDIDGTVLDAGRAIEGAADAVAWLRGRGTSFLFATNISCSPIMSYFLSIRPMYLNRLSMGARLRSYVNRSGRPHTL